jgi:hypothetical protein
MTRVTFLRIVRRHVTFKLKSNNAPNQREIGRLLKDVPENPNLLEIRSYLIEESRTLGRKYTGQGELGGVGRGGRSDDVDDGQDDANDDGADSAYLLLTLTILLPLTTSLSPRQSSRGGRGRTGSWGWVRG